MGAVEDHQLRLEDTEQQMDLREQERRRPATLGVGGCNPVCWRLPPFVLEDASLRTGMRLQPLVHVVAAAGTHSCNLLHTLAASGAYGGSLRCLRLQEDAANEVLKDANALSREEARCDVCEKAHAEVPWKQLEFKCSCGAITLLPPAPPLVVRVEQPCRLQFTLHAEKQDEHGAVSSTVVTAKGAYYLQVRRVRAECLLYLSTTLLDAAHHVQLHARWRMHRQHSMAHAASRPVAVMHACMPVCVRVCACAACVLAFVRACALCARLLAVA